MNDFPKLDNAEELFCEINSYHIGHSSLNMKAFSINGGKPQLIQFVNVRYIEGPVYWIGAEFTTRTAKESFAFGLSLGIRGIKIGDFTLYEVKVNQLTQPTQNKLLALIRKAYSAMNKHKQIYVRILASSCVLVPRENEQNVQADMN